MNLQAYIHLLTLKKITPKQLVEAAINKIETMDGQINAVVAPRFKEALQEAEKDYSGTMFKGIPILIKSLGQNLKGEPSTSASKLLVNLKASTTDSFVKKILDLGFIIIGQTNSPEFGFKNISDSKLYGSVKNPHNLLKTPGGSSGGAAAALVAGYVPVVAASDGGGSIRIPASYCGLVGLKPTRGSMPTGPMSYRGWQGASMNFFLTKSIEDSELLFNATKTNVIQAPFNYVEKNQKQARKLKIAYSLKSPVNTKVSKDAKAAVMNTLIALKDLGHTVVEISPDYDGFKLMESYYLVNGVETAAMIKKIGSSLKRTVTINDIELVSWVLYEYGLSIKGWEMVDALNYWDLVSEIMHDFHNEYDLFLTPTTAAAAPDYDKNYQDQTLLAKMRNIENISNKYEIVWEMFVESLAYTPFTMIANITGQPALSLPLYQNKEGHYLGVQFVAQKGEDKLLLDLGKQLMK